MTTNCDYGKDNGCPYLDVCELQANYGGGDILLNELIRSPEFLYQYAGQSTPNSKLWISENRFFRCFPNGRSPDLEELSIKLIKSKVISKVMKKIDEIPEIFDEGDK
ncbi:MAG: hypothetical protein ABIJ14_01880 [Nanoarchaeota archaeon]|nr:hypothetical protein [Nanoarchaeota archaeon]